MMVLHANVWRKSMSLTFGCPRGLALRQVLVILKAYISAREVSGFPLSVTKKLVFGFRFPTFKLTFVVYSESIDEVDELRVTIRSFLNLVFQIYSKLPSKTTSLIFKFISSDGLKPVD